MSDNKPSQSPAPDAATVATGPVADAISADGALAVAEKEGHAGHAAGDRLSAIYDIPVQLAAVLGKTSMPVNQLLRLGRGAVVELDRKVGEPIDIYVNNRLVARGEVLIVDDHLGITMTEIIKSDG
jgi:flagellar motor switch protein FliN/FliY